MTCTHEAWERDVASEADGLCPLCLQAELSALRERVAGLEAMLYEINSMNDMANLNDAELWNVNGETQNRVDELLKTTALKGE